MDKADKKTDHKSENQSETKYEKPEIVSEPILAFGAVCNGTPKGGRKQTTSAPDNCNSTKLWS